LSTLTDIAKNGSLMSTGGISLFIGNSIAMIMIGLKGDPVLSGSLGLGLAFQNCLCFCIGYGMSTFI